MRQTLVHCKFRHFECSVAHLRVYISKPLPRLPQSSSKLSLSPPSPDPPAPFEYYLLSPQPTTALSSSTVNAMYRKVIPVRHRRRRQMSPYTPPRHQPPIAHDLTPPSRRPLAEDPDSPPPIGLPTSICDAGPSNERLRGSPTHRPPAYTQGPFFDAGPANQHFREAPPPPLPPNLPRHGAAIDYFSLHPQMPFYQQAANPHPRNRQLGPPPFRPRPHVDYGQGLRADYPRPALTPDQQHRPRSQVDGFPSPQRGPHLSQRDVSRRTFRDDYRLPFGTPSCRISCRRRGRTGSSGDMSQRSRRRDGSSSRHSTSSSRSRHGRHGRHH